MTGRAPHTKNMSEQDRLAKNARIKTTSLATRTRRKTMVVQVRELKIVTNKLTVGQREDLARLFLEAKWVRNAALGSQRFDLDYLKELAGQVPVRLPDETYESRPLQVLGGQLTQAAKISPPARCRHCASAFKRAKTDSISSCHNPRRDLVGKTRMAISAVKRLILMVAALATVTLLATQPASAQRINNPIAEFTGLDKITGRIIKFDVLIDETVQFGALQVTPRVCYSRPTTEAPKTTSFVEVDEVTLDAKIKRIFTGWMFAASPGLNAVEHPVYDVWLTNCKQSSEELGIANQ